MVRRQIWLFVVCISFAYGVRAQQFKTLDYLKSISGQKTVAGQHNREPNAQPSKWTDSIFAAAGRYPGLWSGDFLFQSDNIAARWTMIYEAQRQWENGAIVQLLLHTCPPTGGEPCGWNGGVLSSLSEAQWNELITDGTILNANWKKRLDLITPYIQYLKDNGVEVLFRPLHEMNQSAFWWGGRPGPDGTARLYRITHDYLTVTKGLTNLIWVWDMQDIDQSWAQYNPGDGYWDILAFDVYSGGYSQSWYTYALSIAGDKPLAIGECAKLPTASQLLAQPRYVFFMAWAELVFSSNTRTDVSNLYHAGNVVTLGDMPGWGTNVNSVHNAMEDTAPRGILFYENYPNPFNPTTVVSCRLPAASTVKLVIYDVLGRELAVLVDGRWEAGVHDVPFDAAGLPSGVYLYRWVATEEKAAGRSTVHSGRMLLMK